MDNKWVNIFFVASFLFMLLAMGFSLAHLYALPNKMQLDRDDYLISQQVYRGWSRAAIVVFGALFSTLALAVVTRKRKDIFIPVLMALFLFAIGQAIFWIYTYPANQQTNNWGYLPNNWMQLREQWEYSHAAGAILNLLSFTFLLVAVLRKRNQLIPVRR
jgi:hypothetical protein